MDTRIIGQSVLAFGRVAEKQTCSRAFNLTCQFRLEFSRIATGLYHTEVRDCCASSNMASQFVTSRLEGLASAWNQPAATAAELGARGCWKLYAPRISRERDLSSQKAAHRLLNSHLRSLTHIFADRSFTKPKPIHYGAV